jgi:hypothetical protein
MVVQGAVGPSQSTARIIPVSVLSTHTAVNLSITSADLV